MNQVSRSALDRLLECTADAQVRIAARQAADRSAGREHAILPEMQEFLRAMPNHLARSSLCAPIARGRRTFHRETPLVTRADVVMTYTGEQLDEADADLLLQLIYHARLFPLGVAVTVNRAALLRAMGRNTGKSDYAWLHRRIKAMTVATLFIEARKPDGTIKYRVGDTEGFHIVQRFAYDDKSQIYKFILDSQWATLFSNHEFALIDWGKRLQMRRGHEIAKALQRLVATSSDSVQRYALEWLKDKMQYTGRMRDFKTALSRATAELKRVEIALGEIETSTKGREQLVLRIMPRSKPGSAASRHRDSIALVSG